MKLLSESFYEVYYFNLFEVLTESYICILDLIFDQTDANFHPLPCTLWLQKTPHMYLVQKTADHIFYLFTGKEEE